MASSHVLCRLGPYQSKSWPHVCVGCTLSPDSVKRQLLDNPHAFYCSNYFVLGEIRTCLVVSSDPMFLEIFSKLCSRNLLLVQSHEEEIIIVKRLIQGRNNVTRVRVKPKTCNQGCRKTTPLLYSLGHVADLYLHTLQH